MSDDGVVEVVARGERATRRAGEELAGWLRGGDVLVLTGELGAGKTRLVQGLAAGLGAAGRVTSPTFLLRRDHDGGRLRLVHVDAYRLAGPGDLDDLDLDEALAAGAVLAVEWGERVADALPDERLEVHLAHPDPSGTPDRPAGADAAAGDPPADDDEPRRLTLRGRGARWGGELERLGERLRGVLREACGS